MVFEKIEEEYSKPAEQELTIKFKNLGSQKDFWYALSHDNGQTLIDTIREQEIVKRNINDKNISELSRNLIKAIDSNWTSVQTSPGEFGSAIPSKYIDDELEKLREALK